VGLASSPGTAVEPMWLMRARGGPPTAAPPRRPPPPPTGAGGAAPAYVQDLLVGNAATFFAFEPLAG